MTSDTHRQFYIIFSSRALDSLETVIENYYTKVSNEYPKVTLKQLALLVPDKFKSLQTIRTITVIDERVFDFLKKAENEIDEFKIEKLQMKKHFYPNKERSDLPSLYIKLPKNLSLTVVQDHLIERMSTLRSYGIWNKNDYNIYFPQIDRAGNNHGGKAYIYFNGFEEVRLDDIVLTRIFINNTKWPKTNLEVHCHWRRPREALSRGKSDNNESEYTTEVDKSEKVEDKTSLNETKEEDTWVSKVKNSLKKQ